MTTQILPEGIRRVSVIQDGTLSLRKMEDGKDGKELVEMSNKIAKVTTKHGVTTNCEEALSLHFDWLEAMQEQIQEVQGKPECY